MRENGCGELMAAGSPAVRMPDDALSAPERLLGVISTAASVMKAAFMRAEEGLQIGDEWRSHAARTRHLLDSDETRADVARCREIGFGKYNRRTFGIPQAMAALDEIAEPGAAAADIAKRGIGVLQNEMLFMMAELKECGGRFQDIESAFEAIEVGGGVESPLIANQGEGA